MKHIFKTDSYRKPGWVWPQGKIAATCVFIGIFLVTGCFHSGKRSSDPIDGTGTVRKGARGTKPYTIRGKTYVPLLSAHGFKEDGIASWYGKDFHGKQTANGERYNMYGMTAAHKLLPFGTKVRVTNKTNGRSIVVRINDRGPFIDSRVIDLTRTGAEQLGMIGAGTAPVRLETIGTVPSIKNGDMQGRFYVQLGAFSQKSNAESLVSRMQRQGTSARAFYDKAIALWRVQAGPFASLRRAGDASSRLQAQFPSNFIAAE